MNASTIKDYFAKQCTYFKVILLTTIFCMASPMAVYANTQFNFASGQEQLKGHGGFFNIFQKKSHNKEYKWKFKHCKFPIFHNYKFDKDGCSQRELRKGKVDICKQINTHKKTHVFKLCVSESAADKLLESRWGDGDPSNDNGVLSYYSPLTFYQDKDGDEYGASKSVTDCLPPDGYVEDEGDCNDTNAAINPGEADGCPVTDGIDNNCDGVVDNGTQNIFADNDGDGFGSNSIVGCPGSPNTSLEGGDCNDNDAAVNPDAVEVACNSIDDDCNAETSDNDGGVTVYQDLDQDTFGNPNITDTSYCGLAIDGFVSNNADCGDTNQNINPAQSEIACNSLDDDCDASTSDNNEGITVYLDADGDGYGSMTSQLAFCGSIPDGYVEGNTDCNDSEAATNPGASEICDDGVDNNCDGQIDEGCIVASNGCPCLNDAIAFFGEDFNFIQAALAEPNPFSKNGAPLSYSCSATFGGRELEQIGYIAFNGLANLTGNFTVQSTQDLPNTYCRIGVGLNPGGFTKKTFSKSSLTSSELSSCLQVLRDMANDNNLPFAPASTCDNR